MTTPCRVLFASTVLLSALAGCVVHRHSAFDDSPCHGSPSPPSSSPTVPAPTATPPVGPSCESDADCTHGDTCVENACIPKTDRCVYSSECGESQVCANEQCVSPCTDAQACQEGFACRKGVCLPENNSDGSGTCTSDASCLSPENPICLRGACTERCTTEADCRDGWYCRAGACIVDTRPDVQCTIDADCKGTASVPKVCLLGFCKYQCNDDASCRRIDGRLGYCAKDSVCRTAREADAKCKQKADCAASEDCIDHTCQ